MMYVWKIAERHLPNFFCLITATLSVCKSRTCYMYNYLCQCSNVRCKGTPGMSLTASGNNQVTTCLYSVIYSSKNWTTTCRTYVTYHPCHYTTAWTMASAPIAGHSLSIWLSSRCCQALQRYYVLITRTSVTE